MKGVYRALLVEVIAKIATKKLYKMKIVLYY